MDALNIALCLVIAFSLTNALPVRNRSNENFHDYAREAIPRKRSNLKDLYDAYLLRRDPSEGKWLYIYNALKFCTSPVWLRKLYSCTFCSSEANNSEKFSFKSRRKF